MKMVHFVKMHGAGNDFVLIDDRAEQFPVHDHLRLAAFAAARTGIGCEGVILVQPSNVADFRMVFFNPDGTEADLCGNGARCVAAFAREIGAAKGCAMTFETRAGLVDAEVLDAGKVKVWMPEPHDRRYGLDVEGMKGDFIVAGVPHFVVPCESVAAVDVEKLGRRLRLRAQRHERRLRPVHSAQQDPAAHLRARCGGRERRLRHGGGGDGRRGGRNEGPFPSASRPHVAGVQPHDRRRLAVREVYGIHPHGTCEEGL